MFIRRSTYRKLTARAEAYSQTYVEARRAANRKAAPGVARLERLVRACARYRAELAEQRASHLAALARRDRRIEQLQGQLDDVLGMNSDQVMAGAHWQQRRSDKPYTPAEAK